jgi:hypothetical protein
MQKQMQKTEKTETQAYQCQNCPQIKRLHQKLAAKNAEISGFKRILGAICNYPR